MWLWTKRALVGLSSLLIVAYAAYDSADHLPELET